MRLNELPHIIQLYSNGVHFGYPKCCIAYFINTFTHCNRIKRPRPSHNGTGYIPCPKCTTNKSDKIIPRS